MTTREDCPVRTIVRHLLRLGILVGLGYALFRALSTRPSSTTAAEARPLPPQPAVEAPSP